MSQNNILALIPARMGSTRFPGKPMSEILGIPMIGHVYKNVAQNKMLSLTAVATCDVEIANYIRSIGGRVVMTGNHHERASDRCAEALDILEKEEGIKFNIVVMVQGDEPMTHPHMISESVQPLIDDASIFITNLLGKIKSFEEFEDRNCIKVVCDLNNNAMYFSREPIPTRSKVTNIQMFKQVCVISFRSEFLREYTLMTPTPLEIAESVDMMRVLEHGLKIHMVNTEYETRAVDTEEDRARVEKLMM